MKCPFCENECKIYKDQWNNNVFVCQQEDHTYETSFDVMDGVTEILKIGDKIYFGHQVKENLP